MITRITLRIGAALLGLVIGAALVLALGTPPGTVLPDPAPVAVFDPGTSSDTPMPETADALLLVWAAGGLPEGFAAGSSKIDGVTHMTEVVAGRLDLTSSQDRTGAVVDQAEPGWAIPLDAIAIDPVTFAAFVPTGQQPVLQRLEPGTVILSETSASLRNIEVGGQLELGAGGSHTVVGILDDAAIGAAEVVVHRADALAAGMPPRYLLLRHVQQRPAMETALRGVAGDLPLRVRAPGETPYLRHGDAVLPQAILKQRYGEFQYRPPRDGELAFDVDPNWVAEHVVTRQVPILGSVTCHRAAIETVEAVLTELDRRGLAFTVDPADYQGCWNPRLISLGGDLSRHAWGIAIDLNAEGNPTGIGSGQHDALVELFTTASYGWGGTWLVPDPMHFEIVDEPSSPIKVRP